MDDLFRFVSCRPPQAVEPARGVSLTLETNFQVGLINIAEEHSPAYRFDAMNKAAKDFSHLGRFVTSPANVRLGPGYADLRDRITALGAQARLATLEQAVINVFGRTSSQVVADPRFIEDRNGVFDSIIAIFLMPEGQRHPIDALVDIARVIDIVQRVAAVDKALDRAAEVAARLNAVCLLPSPPFPINPSQIQVIKAADLLVVKQHLLRYELGDISHIESIMLGETRKHTTKHSLTVEQSRTLETETTTETQKDLQTTERFELQTEAATTQQENVAVKAGVALSAKYGELQINTNADVAYSKSKSDAVKTATNYSKDVTSRASSKVTKRVRQQLTTTTIEALEETNEHDFENSQGRSNVVGVYQWVNKVYRAQIFNYGKRNMLDIMVPEPAAFLVDALANEPNADPPAKPPDLVTKYNDQDAEVAEHPLTPGDLTENPTFHNYYGRLVALYGADGVEPPPPDHTTVSKAYAAVRDDEVNKADTLSIPEGYEASEVSVQGQYNYEEDHKGDATVGIFVGNVSFAFVHQDSSVRTATLSLREAASIPVAIIAAHVSNYSFTIDIVCKRGVTAFETWRSRTHSAIMQAYQNQLRDYNDKLEAQKLQSAQHKILSGNPEQNRVMERAELKKACLAILSGYDLLQFNGIREESPPPAPSAPTPAPEPYRRFPMPKGDPWQPAPSNLTVEEQGSIVRFFEEAFEWEQMMYFFYPYYWGRKSTWYSQVLAVNDDPIFGQFLNAGEARVVIPVRPSFEDDINYFTMTGRIWSGRALPSVCDIERLPIAEEIRESADAPGAEVPQGDPWLVTLPTTLVKLRQDGKLPAWQQPDAQRWEWVEDGQARA